MSATLPTSDMIPGLTYRRLVLGSLQALAFVCVIVQLMIAPAMDNVMCVALVAITSSLMFQYLWHSDAMTDQPLSSLALLGFTASSQFVALISQSLDLVPFTQYLRTPELTFSVLAVAHVSAITAHFAYRNFLPLKNASGFIAEKLYGPLNIHRIPSPTMVWLIGAVGMLGVLGGGAKMGDVGGKFLDGVSFLVWMPFMLALYRDWLGDDYCKMKVHVPFILAWAVCIVIFGLAKSHRAMMFVGPVQMAIVFIVYKCRNHQPVSRKFLKRLLIGGTALAVVMPQFSDLMIAMEITRGQVRSVSAVEQLEDTAEVFMDKHRIQNFRELSLNMIQVEPYDEIYLDNSLMRRFTETKFHDNMLFLGRNFSDAAKDGLLAHQGLRVIALLPQNLLDALSIKLDKTSLGYSNGDYYANQTYGLSLGSFLVGSIWADLYVLTGPWLPIVIILILWPIFMVQDALSRFSRGQFISPIALCTVYMIYIGGVGSESIFGKFNQLTRGLVQQVLLYALIAAVTAFLLRLFHKQTWWDDTSTGKVLLNDRLTSQNADAVHPSR